MGVLEYRKISFNIMNVENKIKHLIIINMDNYTIFTPLISSLNVE